MQLTSEGMLCLLYHEAKFNVVHGRYALDAEDYHRLAGLQVSPSTLKVVRLCASLSEAGYHRVCFMLCE